MVNIKDIIVFRSLNYRSDSYPLGNLMFLKLAYWQILILTENIKFPQGNYQPMVPRQKHSCFGINLLAFYYECRFLIGYATHHLFCDRY